MIDFDCVATLLSSVLSRINMISACLHDDLSEEIEEIKSNVAFVLKQYNYEVHLSNAPDDFFLDMVSLYKELNIISRDLGICILLTSHNEVLEDAAYGISFIIKVMAEKDCVFGCCYKNAKTRVMK